MRVSRRPRCVMLINAAKFRKTTGLLRRGSALPRRRSLRPQWSTQPAFDHTALQSVAAGQHGRPAATTATFVILMRSSRCPRRVMLINAAKIWKSTLASSLARLSTIMILQPSTILVNTVSLRPCSATISGYWLTRQVIDCYDGHRAELPFLNVTLMRVSRRPRRVMLINAAKFWKSTLASSPARLGTTTTPQPSTILVNTASLRSCSATISGCWST